MSKTRHFVLVFGNPAQNGDALESGRYQAGDAYPEFTVQPGDKLLLYCTEGYPGRPKQFDGTGVAEETNSRLILFQRTPFAEPMPLRSIDENFTSEDRKKMKDIRFNSRRAFEIDRESFVRTVAKQTIAAP